MVVVPSFTLPLPSTSFFFMCLVPGRGRVCREYSLPMSREGYLAPSDPSPPKSLSVVPLARDSSRGSSPPEGLSWSVLLIVVDGSLVGAQEQVGCGTPKTTTLWVKTVEKRHGHSHITAKTIELLLDEVRKTYMPPNAAPVGSAAHP
jgi:hypothetical protein